MYVFEEMINGKKLTEIINETHENVKYLPGHKLPENIVSFAFHRYQLFIVLVRFKKGKKKNERW
jgi:glycerol-3-phosphate dehydrogenase